MSDANTSLPIRTQTNGDVAVKIVDGTTVSQALSVDASGRITTKLDDGNGNIITSQSNGAQRALDVGIDVAGVQIDPRSIRALTSADVVTSNQGTANTISNAWPVKPTDGTNSQAYLSTGEAKVSVTQPLPAGSNLIGQINIDIGGSLVSSTNPVPVVLSAGVSGTVVNNYNTAASIAAAGTSNHTYTITTSKSFQGKKIHAAGSGKIKAEIQISPDGTTFSTIFVAFNSTSTPNIDIDMDQILFLEAAGTGAAIRIIRTNLDILAQDVYSTISGVEV